MTKVCLWRAKVPGFVCLKLSFVQEGVALCDTTAERKLLVVLTAMPSDVVTKAATHCLT